MGRKAESPDIDALDGFIIWFDSFFMPSRDDLVPQNAKAEEWAKTGKIGIAFTTGPGGREPTGSRELCSLTTRKWHLLVRKREST